MTLTSAMERPSGSAIATRSITAPRRWAHTVSVCFPPRSATVRRRCVELSRLKSESCHSQGSYDRAHVASLRPVSGTGPVCQALVSGVAAVVHTPASPIGTISRARVWGKIPAFRFKGPRRHLHVILTSR
jgi:hypothetical protein